MNLKIIWNYKIFVKMIFLNLKNDFDSLFFFSKIDFTILK